MSDDECGVTMSNDEYGELEPGTVCIRPEHLEAGRDCATPDTFDLLQSVTHLLRQAETLEALAKNWYRTGTTLPTKARHVPVRLRDMTQALDNAERVLTALWKERGT